MTTATLPVIGYSFTLAEMFTIPTIQGRSCYACGCFVGIYPGESAMFFEPYPDVVGKKAAFVDAELRQRLTAEELQAILLHEEGHAALGHVERLQAGEPQSALIELEADQYAIEHGASPQAMASGISKALQLTSERLTMTGSLRSFRAGLIRWFAKHSKEYRLRMRQLKSFQ